jgi:hypothetical protein
MASASRSFRLTDDERLELLTLYYKCGGNITKTAQSFKQSHPNRTTVSRLSIRRLILKFKETKSLSNRKPGKPKPVVDSAVASDIVADVERCGQSSVRNLAREYGISHMSVWKILRKEFNPFKQKLVQRLNAEDQKKRVEFCSWFVNEIGPWCVLFTDEAIFNLNGSVSDLFIWARERPVEVNPCRSVHCPKLMVWAGIFGTRVIGPYFFNENVTGKSLVIFR